MKRLFYSLAVLISVLSCNPTDDGITLMAESDFKTTVDGSDVSLYTLKAGDIIMQVTNFGGRVVSLWVPDRNGHYEDIVLGYENIDRYVNNTGDRYFGAVVGPCANRIADGTYTIGDNVYTFPKNDNGQTLHGGLKGLDSVVWDVESVSEDELVLSYLHKDGQEGIPGNLKIVMTYSLTDDNEFCVDYVAETDKAVHVNISHHSYFNLKGEGRGTINDHILMINASRTTPVNEVLIPTGELADVTGTPFDFREPKAIGTDLDVDDEQLANGGGYDHNWVIDRKSEDEMEVVASVLEPSSGRYMEVISDQPALQFYGGNFLDGTYSGKYGRPLSYREAIVMETQKYPDTPNHDNFPSTLLEPGDRYVHSCIYRFSIR